MERLNPRFITFNTITSEETQKGWTGLRGRISPSLLLMAGKGLDHPLYYFCGKPSMVSAVYDILQRMGVPEADMRAEVFRGYWS